MASRRWGRPRRGLSRQARHGRRGRLGLTRRDMAGADGRGKTRHDPAVLDVTWRDTAGMASRRWGRAGRGLSRQARRGWHGEARQGTTGHYPAGQARRDEA